MVDETVYGRVTPQRFDEIAEVAMATSTTVFVPVDTTARSLGADAVAAAIAAEAKRRGAAGRNRPQRLARPVLARAARRSRRRRPRVAYGPVRRGRRRRACSTRISCAAASTRSALGPTEKIDYLAKQTRLTFARVGIIDPLSLDDYRAHGGYRGLANALKMTGEQIVADGHGFGPARPRRRGVSDRHQVEDRARGAADQKYVVCNADEGDSGTFADRMIMESDPFVLIEGMTIAGLAVGATQGYVYIRCRIPAGDPHDARRRSSARRAAGFLGDRHSGQRAHASTSRSARRRARTSAARKPRCSKASRASAAWSATGRRCPRSRACSASRRCINNVIIARERADRPRQGRGLLQELRHAAARAAR